MSGEATVDTPAPVKKGWGVKEIINAVLFSVLTLIITFVAAALTVFHDVFALIFSGPVGCLLAAPVYVLMVRRVNRFGVTTVLGVLFALFVGLMQSDPWSFVWYIVFGVLIDLIFLRTSSQRTKSGAVIGAWSMWSLIYVFSTLLPILRDKEGYMQSMREGTRYTAEYIASFEQYWLNPLWVGIILAISVICGALGAWFGTRMTRKHFEKAGVL